MVKIDNFPLTCLGVDFKAATRGLEGERGEDERE
jgi:hypothetical protein